MPIIYILKLNNNKYYVGRTTNLDNRIRDHKYGYGSAWTKKHGFVELLETFNNESPFYEDMIVKTMMHTHGIENVRGGSYSQIVLPKEQYALLLREINGATDKCFKCGGDHFVSKCTKNNEQQETIGIGWRIYASGIRKTKRLINYLWS